MRISPANDVTCARVASQEEERAAKEAERVRRAKEEEAQRLERQIRQALGSPLRFAFISSPRIDVLPSPTLPTYRVPVSLGRRVSRTTKETAASSMCLRVDCGGKSALSVGMPRVDY